MAKAQRRSSHQKPTAANGGKVDALCRIAVRLGCQLAKYANVFLANHRATGAEMVKEPTLDDLGVPRFECDRRLSLVGRIRTLVSK